MMYACVNQTFIHINTIEIDALRLYLLHVAHQL